MAHPSTQILAVAIIIFVVSGSAMPIDQVIYCAIVYDELTPCLPYILGDDHEPTPIQACCDGVKNLGRYLKNKNGQGNICTCIKEAAALEGVPVDAFAKVSSLPGACSLPVALPPISSNIDCPKVK